MALSAEEIQQAYRRVFSSPDAQIVLADLIRAHCCLESTFSSPEDSDTIVAYREGGRNAVLRLLAMAGKRLTVTE